jgi:ATP-binding cassette, subfamily B, bacterial
VCCPRSTRGEPAAGAWPRVREALQESGGEDVLRSLPAGLHSQLGASWPDGIDLSGGQWQKVALGRALMRQNPLLLILDEPTSALDATAEHALFSRYRSLSQQARSHGAITVFVTHRFSTAADADQIVVLEQGRIVEIGNHAELVSKGGSYADLYELQATGYRDTVDQLRGHRPVLSRNAGPSGAS